MRSTPGVLGSPGSSYRMPPKYTFDDQEYISHLSLEFAADYGAKASDTTLRDDTPHWLPPLKSTRYLSSVGDINISINKTSKSVIGSIVGITVLSS